MCLFKCSSCGRLVPSTQIWNRYEDGVKVYYCESCVCTMVDSTTCNGLICGA